GRDAMLIDHQELRTLAARIFEAGRSSREEAEIIADHLVEANLRGHDSHGVGMVPRYIGNLKGGTVVPNNKGRVVSGEGAFLVYDGERGYGQVVAREATKLGIARAHDNGVAVVALRNAHHIGRVGTYGELCAEAGLVSVSFVNVHGHGAIVAPHRGSDARLSTNPVCIAVPAAEPGRPIILDMATSRVAMGKVRVARNKGDALPPGHLIDAKGRPSNDPNVMFQEPRGALMPFAEHKGYALALICELLAGAVGGGGTLRPENQQQGTITNGMLSFVIDPTRIAARGAIAEEINAITRYVTASPPAKAGEPVLIPGDPERLMRAKRMKEGVPVDAETWREVLAAARSLGVTAESPAVPA
ncbi:MAG: malate/lactate/ureidoglycolate dehydrogenase, partial [Alphaproteobacteria bacterium]